MAEIIVNRYVFRDPLSRPFNPIGDAETRSRGRKHPKMVLRCGSLSLTVPYAPVATTTNGFGAVWVEVPRPGRLPLLLRTAPKLRTQQWDLFFGDRDINRDQGPLLNILSQMADSLTPISITRGPGGTQRWHITEMSIAYTAKAQQTNAATRATATITITQSSELAPAPGPVAGGVKAPVKAAPKAAVKPTAKPPAKPAVRVHTVARGDTLRKISQRYYGTPDRWKPIATANAIRNPDRITVGQRLRIP